MDHIFAGKVIDTFFSAHKRTRNKLLSSSSPFSGRTALACASGKANLKSMKTIGLIGFAQFHE